MLDMKSFRNPPDSCRGTDFWMLNDRLEPDELRRQMRTMREQGVVSFIARTYIGLKSDYPGEDFMDKMSVIIDEARALKMTVFLQAGYMPEAVLGLPPEFALGDVRVFAKGEGSDKGELIVNRGQHDYRLLNSRTILDMLNPDAVKFYILQSYENMWKRFRDDFGTTVQSVWVDEPSYGHVSMPWTGRLPAAYRSLWGSDFPMDKIHLLFEDGEGSATLRHHYWRTILELLKTAYFTEIRDWCRNHNLKFSGHLMAEDKMESQIKTTCFTMPYYKFFDIPGIDYLTAEMNWRYGEITSNDGSLDDMWAYGRIVTPLQCSSAAHQAGKEQILCEMYGVSTENLSLRDQRHMFDSFAALGINHRSVHGIFYSLRGRGKRAYPPHISDYQPYWPQYHLLTDALARETWFVRQGKPVRDVLVLHPMESAFCEYRGPGVCPTGNDVVRIRDRNFLRLMRDLTGMKCNVELGDEDTIADTGDVRGDRLVIGEMQYRTVVIADMRTIRESTLKILERFAANGGTILVSGEMPEMIDGNTTDAAANRLLKLSSLQRTRDLQDLLHRLASIKSAYRYESDENFVYIHYRETGSDKLFFICNTDCREGHDGTIIVDGDFSAAMLNCEDGSGNELACSCTDGTTRIPLHITEGSSVMIQLTPSKSSAQIRPARNISQLLPSAWTVERHDPNVLLLEFASYRKGDETYSNSYPILAIQDILSRENYNGDISLRYTFTSDIAVAGTRLALESPELQQLTLDGKAVSNKSSGRYLAQAFELLQLPDLAAGEHVLEIRRHFEPLKKALSGVTSLFENLPGVELEPILLLVEYAVTSVTEPGISGCVRLAPRFTITAETKTAHQELVSEGYPFYAGTISLKQTFHLDKNDAKRTLYIEAEGFNACVGTVYVNGKRAGDLLWTPYKAPLTGLVREGANELEIRITNTLRNVLGPWHRPAGEIGACWAGYEYPNQPWLGVMEHGKQVSDWHERRVPDRHGWTESYLLLPFGIRQTRLVIEQ
ncbi:MAG: hypothetical protein HZC28_15375 [Spirochaetes bacterium]|nr:hypothetical protein [Spirochaetota bacterium]